MFLKLKRMHDLPQNLVPDTVQSGPLYSKKCRFSLCSVWFDSMALSLELSQRGSMSNIHNTTKLPNVLDVWRWSLKLKIKGSHAKRYFMSVKWWTSSFMPNTVTKQCSYKTPGPTRDSWLYSLFSDVCTSECIGVSAAVYTDLNPYVWNVFKESWWCHLWVFILLC